jgi:hypothetical protein
MGDDCGEKSYGHPRHDDAATMSDAPAGKSEHVYLASQPDTTN